MIPEPAFTNRTEVSFNDELLILVDENDEVTGYDKKFSVHEGSGKLHRAFSIFLFSPCGHVLMQQRSALKPLWPLFWSNSVCSHPRKGETCELAAERRLQEELAVSAELRMLFQFEYSAEFGSVGAEHELCKVYSACVDIDYPIVANENEIADWEWIAIDELESRIATSPELYTPWLLMEWSRIRSKGYRDLQSATAVVVR